MSELAHVKDVLVKAFSSANTDLSQLGEAMKYAGPVASAAGIQFEEAAAALSMMGNAGIQGSMAGTSLRGAITRILDPTKKVRAAMAETGLEFTDAQGRLIPFVEIVRQLEDHADDAGLFMALFGQRAGPAMAALAGQGADALADLTTELEGSGGTAEQIAAVQMEGFNGAVRELKSAVEGMMIAIGESGLLEFMTDLAREATAFVREISAASPELLKWGSVVAGALIVLGPFIWMMGKAVTVFGNLVPLVSALATGIGNLSALAGGFAIFLGIFAGLALIVAGAAENWDKVAAAFERIGGGVIDTLISALQALGALLSGDFAAAGEALRGVWEGISSAFGGISDLLGALGEGMVNVLDNLIPGFKDIGFQIADAVRGAVDAMFAAGGELIAALWEGMKAKVAGMIDWVAGVGDAIIENITGNAPHPYEAQLGKRELSDDAKRWIAYFDRVGPDVALPSDRTGAAAENFNQWRDFYRRHKGMPESQGFTGAVEAVSSDAPVPGDTTVTNNAETNVTVTAPVTINQTVNGASAPEAAGSAVGSAIDGAANRAADVLGSEPAMDGGF